MNYTSIIATAFSGFDWSKPFRAQQCRSGLADCLQRIAAFGSRVEHLPRHRSAVVREENTFPAIVLHSSPSGAAPDCRTGRIASGAAPDCPIGRIAAGALAVAAGARASVAWS